MFVSDTHLGTRGARCDFLANFLNRTTCQKLFLVGDIFDGWRLRKSWYWDEHHDEVLRQMQLRRLHFGARSEHLPEEQLQLGCEAIEQAIARAEAEAEKRDPELHKDNTARRRASRGALPAHLPRIAVTLAPEDTACPCCRSPMTVIGEDTSERLDVISAQFRVIVTRRPSPPAGPAQAPWCRPRRRRG